MQNVAILLIGFSVFYALVLLLSHFREDDYQGKRVIHFMGVLLLLSLSGLQLAHFYYLQYHSPIIFSRWYLLLLFLVAPCFYFYTRPLLKAQFRLKPLQWLHFLPLVSVFMLPYKYVFTLAFMLGSIYLLWLLSAIYALRKHRDKFKAEIILLSFVFVVAIVVSVLALTMPFSEELFYALYASAIGLALLIVALILGHTPKISEHVSEVARETYAVSTLTA
ncbi:MAG TPA: AraC family transcriptional regulator, partial [Oceanospirillales bacterium]|nr:AraC family transcriptional regulator [Oceanospirillales bacterium]